jgi:hypothetical protein
MAFEEIWAPFAVMLMFAVFLFPALYLLGIIYKKISPDTGMRKAALIFFMSFLVAMVSYPFSISEDYLPFNSSMGTYALSLLFIFVVYLVVFNRTKE